MPCEAKPRFLVLYGSQKGQAQSIAEGIADEAGEHGLVAEISCLSQKEKVANLRQSPSLGVDTPSAKPFLYCYATTTQ